MANSDWSFDQYKRPEKPTPPSDRAVPVTPRADRIPEPELIPAGVYEDAIAKALDGELTFDPIAELAAEGLVDIFVHELDILDCPACFAQHFKLGEKCRRHDV